MSEAKGSGSGSQKDLLKRAMAYCWSENFLGRFRNYFTDNAHVFEEHAKKIGPVG